MPEWIQPYPSPNTATEEPAAALQWLTEGRQCLHKRVQIQRCPVQVGYVALGHPQALLATHLPLHWGHSAAGEVPSDLTQGRLASTGPQGAPRGAPRGTAAGTPKQVRRCPGDRPRGNGNIPVNRRIRLRGPGLGQPCGHAQDHIVLTRKHELRSDAQVPCLLLPSSLPPPLPAQPSPPWASREAALEAQRSPATHELAGGRAGIGAQETPTLGRPSHFLPRPGQ